MEKFILNNEIPLITKENSKTPRIALCMYMNLNSKEKYAGALALVKALLYQGTKNRSGAELAKILEENGIECYTSSTKDSFSFKLLCLNEDFKLGLEILKDIVFNSTFEEFEKEKTKIKGELLSDLDSPQIQAFDGFTKTIFNNHPYGISRSLILEEIDKLSADDIKEYYFDILNNSKKNITVVGDFSNFGGRETVKNLVYETFKDLKNNENSTIFDIPQMESKKVVTKTKKDIAQAQIIQGWLFPPVTHKDSPAIQVMNTILGSSGLSSRLFLELREKKGLAYTVRSCYDKFKLCGCLWVYIGTNPVNIQTAVDGFKVEIDKMKNDLVSDEELLGGKNNIIGKREFILESNIQQASAIGLYELLGLGYDFEEKFRHKIESVTAEDVKRVANEYFNDKFVLYALANNVNLKL